MYPVLLNFKSNLILKNQKKLNQQVKNRYKIQSMLNLCIKNLDEINFFRPKEKRPKNVREP